MRLLAQVQQAAARGGEPLVDLGRGTRITKSAIDRMRAKLANNAKAREVFMWDTGLAGFRGEDQRSHRRRVLRLPVPAQRAFARLVASRSASTAHRGRSKTRAPRRWSSRRRGEGRRPGDGRVRAEGRLDRGGAGRALSRRQRRERSRLAPQQEDSTWKIDARQIRQHIVPALGRKLVADVTSEDVEALQARIAKVRPCNTRPQRTGWCRRRCPRACRPVDTDELRHQAEAAPEQPLPWRRAQAPADAQAHADDGNARAAGRRARGGRSQPGNQPVGDRRHQAAAAISAPGAAKFWACAGRTSISRAGWRICKTARPARKISS